MDNTADLTLTIWSHWVAKSWTGTIPAPAATNPVDVLEYVFRWFNVVEDEDRGRMLAVGYRLPLLSTGDRVTFNGRVWVCAGAGWEEIGAAYWDGIDTAGGE